MDGAHYTFARRFVKKPAPIEVFEFSGGFGTISNQDFALAAKIPPGPLEIAF